MIRKTVLKSISIVAVLAMLLALLPAAGAHAAVADITGTLYGVPEKDLHVSLTANRTGGSAGVTSCQVTITTSGSSNDPFTITGCDNADTFTVTAQDLYDSFYTYNTVTGVTGGGFANLKIGVLRTFSGKIFRDGGFPISGSSMPIKIDGVSTFAPPTDSTGTFTFQLPDFKSVIFYPDGSVPAGVRVDGANWTANAPLKNDYTSLLFTYIGTRHVWVDIQGSGPCREGATVSFSPQVGGQVITGITDGNGHMDTNRLEPLAYNISVQKDDCDGVFEPTTLLDTAPLTQQDNGVSFNIPTLGIHGQAQVDGNPDATLAYWLVANISYTVGGVVYNYQSSIEPFGGRYDIQAPYHGGTLSISRIGGAAGLGYDPVSIPINPTPGQHDVFQNIPLNPNRTITGKVLGQNDVPVFKDARLDFGNGLSSLGSGAADGSFSINNAQPKLYYIAPSNNPIAKLETPVRALANLTALDSADVGTFTANYWRVAYDGCMRTDNNEKLVLPAGSVRIRSMVGSVATYTATITENDTSMCGSGPANQSYHFGYDVPIPSGVYGPLEVDNHLVRSSPNYIYTWDGSNINDIRVWGDRMISGKLFYAVSPDIDLDDGNFWNTSTLQDAVTNDVVNTSRDYDGRTHEFQVPNVERKSYKLTFNGTIQGYDLLPNPGIPAWGSPITTDLTSGNVDLGVMYLAQHKPIPEGTRTPAAGATVAGSGIFDFSWSEPELNGKDRFYGYQLQFATSGTIFTNTFPTVVDLQQGTNTYHVTALTPGVYQWRVRANYMYFRDFGPWTALDSFTVPSTSINIPTNTSPANGAVILTSPAAAVTFQWTTDPASQPGYKYQVQYSTTSDFGSGNTTLASVDDPTHQAVTPGALTTKLQYFWHVRVLDSSSNPVSAWSPTWNFFYNLLYPTVSSLSYTKTSPNITFTATQTNAVLPADARYQMQFVLSASGWPGTATSANTWTFVIPANGVPSAAQSLSGLPAGTYKWRMRIVSATTPYSSSPYTFWAVPTAGGMTTFTAP